MSRTKKVPFADMLGNWAEAAPEEEFRDAVVSLSTYARHRKMKFRIEIKTAPAEKALPLLDQKEK